MASVIAAASRTGELGSALSELVEHERAVPRVRGGILKGLAYPLVVTCLAAVILLFIIICVGGNAQRILIDFDVSLPAITIVFFWCAT